MNSAFVLGHAPVVELRLPSLFMELVGPASSESLVERLRRGDVTAIAEAYDAHHVHVRAFAQRLVGEASVAEDLVQEVFLTLPNAIRSFRGESSLRTFLVSIGVNHARHYVRAAVRRRATTRGFAAEPPATPVDSPEELLQRRQLADALSRALDELPIEQRVAIVLCEVEERTSAEAAQIAGAPEATMRTRVFHAKRKLREVLARRAIR